MSHTHYDTIVVLGSKPDTKTWNFPAHVTTALNYAAKSYKAGEAPCLIVSGKWALSFDSNGIRQPYRECDKMAEYLIEKGVPASAILLEGDSKDTISNLFYIKRRFLKPSKLHKILFLTADFRLGRIQFLCAKILGKQYKITFKTVPNASNERYPHEQDTLKRTKQFLKYMQDGDDAFLEDKFYDAEFYR